jgi:hypothetical protein
MLTSTIDPPAATARFSANRPRRMKVTPLVDKALLDVPPS